MAGPGLFVVLEPGRHPRDFDIAENIGFLTAIFPAAIFDLPAAHFLAVRAHRITVGAWRRRAQIGLGGTKCLGDGGSGMGAPLDHAGVAAVVWFLENFDHEYHGEDPDFR